MFRQIFECALLCRTNRGVERVRRRKDDDIDVGIFRYTVRAIIQSVPVWQLNIRYQNVTVYATQQLATSVTRACGLPLLASPTQRFSADGAARLIVIQQHKT